MLTVAMVWPEDPQLWRDVNDIIQCHDQPRPRAAQTAPTHRYQRNCVHSTPATAALSPPSSLCTGRGRVARLKCEQSNYKYGFRHPTAETARLLSFLITLLQQINFSDDEAYVENTLNFTNSSSTVLGISERNVILEDRWRWPGHFPSILPNWIKCIDQKMILNRIYGKISLFL